MRVSVVIPNWNGARRLEALLPALRQQTRLPDDILVMDNGSNDNSCQVARLNEARVLAFSENYGFARAVNYGVRNVVAEYVLILNNDVLLDPGWLMQVISTIGEAPFAVGKLLSASQPDVVDGCFDAVCRGACAWRCGHARPDGVLWNESRPVQFPPFTAILIRRDFFLEMGGLDEGLESYLEDVEFGLRCASKGYSGIYVPGAVGYHEGSATLGRWSPRTVRKIARNQLLLVARYYTPRMLLRFGWPIAVAQSLWGLVALKHGAGFAWIQGKIDGLRLFGSFRRTSSDSLVSVLGSSEDEIRQLQRLTRWDWYWRVYFALT